MSIEVVRFAKIPATRWKNGLGATTQLAIHPSGSDANAFEWRVSIATLTGTAAFSDFTGFERCLAVLQGEVTLLRDGLPPLRLTAASSPITFPGSERIVGRVDSEHALDLNLIYRAWRWRASMKRMSIDEGESIRTRGLTMFCACDIARVGVGTEQVILEPFDLLRLNEANIELVALSDVSGWTIELRERAA